MRVNQSPGGGRRRERPKGRRNKAAAAMAVRLKVRYHLALIEFKHQQIVAAAYSVRGERLTPRSIEADRCQSYVIN